MRKTLATVVLSLIGAAVIAGCTSQATPTPLPTTPTTATTTATPYVYPYEYASNPRLHKVPQEVEAESMKPEYDVQAVTVSGQPIPKTQVELIRDSSRFIEYPQALNMDGRSTNCVVKTARDYSKNGNIGIAPRLTDDPNKIDAYIQLTGFAVWARKAGAPIKEMDILGIGYGCIGYRVHP